MRALTLCCFFLAPLAAAAQTPDDALTFEVASVKPHVAAAGHSEGSSQEGGPGSGAPGRITVSNRMLRSMLIEAYGIRNFQIEHPAWVGENRYDIVAKVPAGATKQQAQIMMRNLLKERFQLQIRREKRDLPVYALVPAKSGVKMKPSAETAAAAPDAIDLNRLKTGSDGLPQAPGAMQGIMTTYADGKAKATGQRETLSKLVTWLTGMVDRPVINQTGLKGEYDFTLVWSGSNPDADAGADFIVAFQQQLGLKLEPRKMPIDMLIVVSGVKVPIEN